MELYEGMELTLKDLADWTFLINDWQAIFNISVKHDTFKTYRIFCLSNFVMFFSV